MQSPHSPLGIEPQFRFPSPEKRLSAKRQLLAFEEFGLLPSSLSAQELTFQTKSRGHERTSSGGQSQVQDQPSPLWPQHRTPFPSMSATKLFVSRRTRSRSPEADRPISQAKSRLLDNTHNGMRSELGEFHISQAPRTTAGSSSGVLDMQYGQSSPTKNKKRASAQARGSYSYNTTAPIGNPPPPADDLPLRRQHSSPKMPAAVNNTRTASPKMFSRRINRFGSKKEQTADDEMLDPTLIRNNRHVPRGRPNQDLLHLDYDFLYGDSESDELSNQPTTPTTASTTDDDDSYSFLDQSHLIGEEISLARRVKRLSNNSRQNRNTYYSTTMQPPKIPTEYLGNLDHDHQLSSLQEDLEGEELESRLASPRITAAKAAARFSFSQRRKSQTSASSIREGVLQVKEDAPADHVASCEVPDALADSSTSLAVSRRKSFDDTRRRSWISTYSSNSSVSSRDARSHLDSALSPQASFDTSVDANDSAADESKEWVKEQEEIIQGLGSYAEDKDELEVPLVFRGRHSEARYASGSERARSESEAAPRVRRKPLPPGTTPDLPTTQQRPQNPSESPSEVEDTVSEPSGTASGDLLDLESRFPGLPPRSGSSEETVKAISVAVPGDGSQVVVMRNSAEMPSVSISPVPLFAKRTSSLAAPTSPTSGLDNSFLRIFRRFLRMSSERDAFVHRQPRFEFVQAARAAAALKQSTNLASDDKPLPPTPPGSSLHRSGSLSKDNIRNDAEEECLTQLWVHMASRWLNRGRILVSPVHDMLLTDPLPGAPQRRILDLAGNPLANWAWHAAYDYPTTHIITAIPSFPPSHPRHIDELNSFKRPSNCDIIAVPCLWKLPFPDNHFDVVSLRSAYMWLHSQAIQPHSGTRSRSNSRSPSRSPSPVTPSPDDEYSLLLAELFRVLRPGGHLEYTLADADIANPGPLAARLSARFAFHLLARRLDPKPTLSWISRLHSTGFSQVNRAWVVLPLHSTSARPPSPSPGKGVGGTSEVSPITGLLGSFVAEKWMQFTEFDVGAEEMSAVLAEGAELGSAWRMLVGWGVKPDLL